MQIIKIAFRVKVVNKEEVAVLFGVGKTIERKDRMALYFNFVYR